MVNLTELETQAMQLPDSQRAVLAAHLLDSLPAVLHDEDSGIAEAIRRNLEMDEDPSVGISLEEFRKSFGR